MAFTLTEKEYRQVELLPEEDLADLAVELDVVLEEVIDRRAITTQCVLGLGRLAAEEGLPFSDYDQEDLARLPPEWRKALARKLGVGDDAEAIVKAGRRLYKQYTRNRPRSQVPLVLPSLLEPLCRLLYMAEEGGEQDPEG